MPLRRLATFGLVILAGCRDAPVSLVLDPGAPSGTFESGPPTTASGQVATVGQPITIALIVVDQNRNNRPIAGVRVAWTVVRGSGSTNVSSTVSDSSGLATVSWTLDTIVKLDSMQASLASGASLLITATGRHASPAIATKVSGDAQSIPIGTPSQPFVVRVTDRYGNPVDRMLVAWGALGAGSLSAITSSTDANGLTQVTLTPTAVGIYTVAATYGVMPATVFALTSH